MIILDITPIAKPRMTRRDRWLDPPRKCVEQYREYRATLEVLAAAKKVVIQPELSVTFILPMPAGWSEKKKREHFMNPHQQKRKNDLDNLVKALKDILCDDDSYVWRYKDVCKLWGYKGQIEFP